MLFQALHVFFVGRHVSRKIPHVAVSARRYFATVLTEILNPNFPSKTKRRSLFDISIGGCPSEARI